MTHPKIVQGGMGIYASPWWLARIVSILGQLGVVSGAAIHHIFARVLQNGDPGGHYRRALKSFPNQTMVKRIIKQYFVKGGISTTTRYKHIEQFTLNPSRHLIELTILANYCQVWLAKEDHNGLIGVNFLEKMQMPLIYAIYGVLLAKVDYLIIGAGIPTQISGVLDNLIQHKPTTYNIYVIGGKDPKGWQMKFNPRQYLHHNLPTLRRPFFCPIISSATIARMMIKGRHQVDIWIAETYVAGGHSINPRIKGVLTDDGQPQYSERDEISYADLQRFNIPFYCAGKFTHPDLNKLEHSSPEMLAFAESIGALGIQVGSIFALSDDSGIQQHLRAYMRKYGYNGQLIVFNDPVASPTGFSFKVVKIPETLGNPEVYTMRKRICNIGELLQPYLKKNGKIVYRCSAEPVRSYCKKGGKEEDTTCKSCLCNGLFGTVNLGQRLKNGSIEPAIVTLGQDLSFLQHLMCNENDTYSAEDAIKYLLS